MKKTLVKRKPITLSHKRSVMGLLFISPFLIGFAFFYLRGLIASIQLSLSHVTEAQGGYETTFAGLTYYKMAFFEHGTFKQDLVSSMGNMLIDVPLIIFFSLFVAILLNQKFRGRTFVRAVFFLPVILNSQAIDTAISTARRMMSGGLSSVSEDIMETSTSGTVNINYYINMLGDIALPTSILEYIVSAIGRISSIVTASGVQIVIFIAALQAIPYALYEVSKIEGATAYETFWKVTFPMVSPLILTNVVYTVVVSFMDSRVVTLSYNTIFSQGNNYPLGSVFSLVSTAAVCLLLLVVGKLMSRRIFYQN